MQLGIERGGALRKLACQPPDLRGVVLARADPGAEPPALQPDAARQPLAQASPGCAAGDCVDPFEGGRIHPARLAGGKPLGGRLQLLAAHQPRRAHALGQAECPLRYLRHEGRLPEAAEDGPRRLAPGPVVPAVVGRPRKQIEDAAQVRAHLGAVPGAPVLGHPPEPPAVRHGQ